MLVPINHMYITYLGRLDLSASSRLQDGHKPASTVPTSSARGRDHRPASSQARHHRATRISPGIIGSPTNRGFFSPSGAGAAAVSTGVTLSRVQVQYLSRDPSSSLLLCAWQWHRLRLRPPRLSFPLASAAAMTSRLLSRPCDEVNSAWIAR